MKNLWKEILDEHKKQVREKPEFRVEQSVAILNDSYNFCKYLQLGNKAKARSELIKIMAICARTIIHLEDGK